LALACFLLLIARMCAGDDGPLFVTWRAAVTGAAARLLDEPARHDAAVAHATRANIRRCMMP
jgi:hypothetical protein